MYNTNNSPFRAVESQKYKVSDFGINKYDNLMANTSISHCGAFWLDLYLAKIGDFKPTSSDLTNCNTIGNSLNVFNGDFRMLGPKTIIFDDNKGGWAPFYKAMKGVYFQFIDTNTHVKPRIFLKIDQKLDDSLYDSGNLRGFCYSSRTSHNKGTQVSYQDVVNNGYTCHDFYYKLIDYNML